MARAFPWVVIYKKFGPFLDLCVSSLRRGHANLLCIVPILLDVLEDGQGSKKQRRDGGEWYKQENFQVETGVQSHPSK